MLIFLLHLTKQDPTFKFNNNTYHLNISGDGDIIVNQTSKYKDKLKSVFIGSGITSINESSFYEFENLENVTFEIGSKLGYIGGKAFARTNISFLVIPSSVMIIENYSFYSCSELDSITFNDSSALETIGEYAFSEAKSIKRLEIPKSCKYIGAGAFSACNNLESIVLHDGLEVIGDGCFQEIYSLKEFIVPSSVEYIGIRAFSNSSIVNFTFADDCKLEKLANNTFELAKIDVIKIPDTVKSIGSGCFLNSSVSIVTLGANIIEIGNLSFVNCSNLNELYYLGSHEFSDSDDLDIFSGSPLKKVYVTVNYTGEQFFSLPVEIEGSQSAFSSEDEQTPTHTSVSIPTYTSVYISPTEHPSDMYDANHEPTSNSTHHETGSTMLDSGFVFNALIAVLFVSAVVYCLKSGRRGNTNTYAPVNQQQTHSDEFDIGSDASESV